MEHGFLPVSAERDCRKPQELKLPKSALPKVACPFPIQCEAKRRDNFSKFLPGIVNRWHVLVSWQVGFDHRRLQWFRSRGCPPFCSIRRSPSSWSSPCRTSRGTDKRN